ncbi:hypothetical protein DFH07DRAFT_761014, partial [Mycena maculata]
YTALASRKRPERQPGLTASDAAHLIHESVRKRFATGPWSQHLPLHLLTDAYCARDNSVTAKELDDLWSFDSSRGIVPTAKPLDFEPEKSLDFQEWFQAWGRLLELIRTYVSSELEVWLKHYNRILHTPNKLEEWPIWVAYDAEVRRRSCTTALDPSEFQISIWNDLEAKHIARVTIQTVRAEMAKASASSPKLQGSNRYEPYPLPSTSSFRARSTSSFRGNPNRLHITGAGSQPQFRCFICGDTDPSHRSRSCSARKLINGRDTILFSHTPGTSRTDRNGVSYCYSWNGRAGCDKGVNCDHGKHWCSLCGSKDGSHTAQGCPAV